MNLNRVVDEAIVNSEKIYVGNKIVHIKHIDKKTNETYSHYDISITKELFNYASKGLFFSLTDFSNFQHFERLTNITSVFQAYQELKIFEPMQESKYYATHLVPLWKYIKSTNFTDAIEFLRKYNERLIKNIQKKIDQGEIQTTDWYYNKEVEEKDLTEIISVKEEELLQTLTSIQGPIKIYQKQLSKPFFKEKK